MKRPPKATKKLPVTALVVTASLFVIALALVIIFWQPIVSVLENVDRLKEVVAGAGVFGPLIFIAIQFLQVLIAPIPGHVVGFAAGALFGTGLGTLYSMIGALLGMIVVISLARKLGRPFVERFVDKKTLAKFDYLVNGSGPIVFFIIMLLPVFPDDLICYLVGLSRIPVRTLVVVGVLGRLPTTLGAALIGSGAASLNVQLVVTISLIIAAVAALAYWKRRQLEAWVKHLSQRTRK